MLGFRSDRQRVFDPVDAAVDRGGDGAVQEAIEDRPRRRHVGEELAPSSIIDLIGNRNFRKRRVKTSTKAG